MFIGLICAVLAGLAFGWTFAFWFFLTWTVGFIALTVWSL